MGDVQRGKTPALLVEHLVWDDLEDDRRRQILSRLEEEGETDRVQMIEASNDAILGALPTEAVVVEVERRLHVERARRDAEARRRRVTFWTGGLAVAVALVAAVWFGPWFVEEHSTHKAGEGLEVTRAKSGGIPDLLIHRRLDVGSEQLEPGASLDAGDVIRVGYNAAGWPHGVILSLDGGGAVTLHHPIEAGLPTALNPVGIQYLETAFELDGAPRFERFFIVVGESPMDTASVLEAARVLASDPTGAEKAQLMLPEGFKQASFMLLKESP